MRPVSPPDASAMASTSSWNLLDALGQLGLRRFCLILLSEQTVEQRGHLVRR